jgi:hypothetical protein
LRGTRAEKWLRGELVAGLAKGLETGGAVEGGGQGDKAGACATYEVFQKSLDAGGLQV